MFFIAFLGYPFTIASDFLLYEYVPPSSIMSLNGVIEESMNDSEGRTMWESRNNSRYYSVISDKTSIHTFRSKKSRQTLASRHSPIPSHRTQSGDVPGRVHRSSMADPFLDYRMIVLIRHAIWDLAVLHMPGEHHLLHTSESCRAYR
jgi:hypothetical protein